MSTTAFMGIDVSKGYADFLLLDQRKTSYEKSFQLDDTAEGHANLEIVLQRFQHHYGIKSFLCGVESTGGFENNWYEHIRRLGTQYPVPQYPVQVSRLNPSVIKANREATLQRNITDAESARFIAEYLIDHPTEVDYHQGGSTVYQVYRSVHRTIQLQTKQRTQLNNQLKQLLYSSFPEILHYCRRSIPRWVLHVLVKYPSAKKISSQPTGRLIRIRFLTEDKAHELRRRATQSIASRTDQGYDYLIQTITSQLLEMDTRIEHLKEHLAKQCIGPEIDLLKSIPGFGDYTAAVTMIEIENVDRFENPKKLASYFGIHPILKSSGDKAAFRMSKQGRPALRGLLYMAALSAVRYDDHFREMYHHLRSKGKHHSTAIVAVMHTLLRVVWGILRSNTPYNAAIDQANMHMKPRTQDAMLQRRKETVSKRRYQKLAVDAPISRKQRKQRQEHIQTTDGEVVPV